MADFKLYRRKERIEARPYVPGEKLRNVIISNHVEPGKTGE